MRRVNTPTDLDLLLVMLDGALREVDVKLSTKQLLAFETCVRNHFEAQAWTLARAK